MPWFPSGLWALPRPGIELMSPALVDGLFTGQPVKPLCPILKLSAKTEVTKSLLCLLLEVLDF